MEKPADFEIDWLILRCRRHRKPRKGILELLLFFLKHFLRLFEFFLVDFEDAVGNLVEHAEGFDELVFDAPVQIQLVLAFFDDLLLVAKDVPSHEEFGGLNFLVVLLAAFVGLSGLHNEVTSESVGE